MIKTKYGLFSLATRKTIMHRLVLTYVPQVFGIIHRGCQFSDIMEQPA